ncbi:hypothetical protein, partial [Chloroflexus sp.]|uniref:hypothetical protein n=1 Tax=Chloroflexus sp. TaxID=1904827 RepID=UPI002ADE91A4
AQRCQNGLLACSEAIVTTSYQYGQQSKNAWLYHPDDGQIRSANVLFNRTFYANTYILLII